ncbi:hypothetical protein [Telmatospirillum sp. J64-1]|uniref:hypothetical protein n=1 Tax=Telmatospirillum sp. J64-1 TaxID=2502183 RepID=UPI00115E5A06|nr:hypothetical protein [Telmatospirillum sp. J64-1]
MYPPEIAQRFKDQAGQKYRPSNGTEGEIFLAAWCARCIHEAAHRADPDNEDGCLIIAASFAFDIEDEEYPQEWQYGEDGQPKCTAFAATEKDYRCPLTPDLFEVCKGSGFKTSEAKE